MAEEVRAINMDRRRTAEGCDFQSSKRLTRPGASTGVAIHRNGILSSKTKSPKSRRVQREAIVVASGATGRSKGLGGIGGKSTTRLLYSHAALPFTLVDVVQTDCVRTQGHRWHDAWKTQS